MKIRAKDIEVTLPGGRPLFKVGDFAVNAGEHVLIQGESGCGKSTWLHVLAGLLEIPRGEVVLGETPITSLGEAERARFRRARVGVIFQKLNLIDHLTVAENVRLALAPGTPESEIDAALGQVNLEGRARDRVAPLSLGEQQRVAVARVLAQKPNLILADEPTSSLDATNAELIVRSLKAAARGQTLIVVSHDVRLAPRFDRILSFTELQR